MSSRVTQTGFEVIHEPANPLRVSQAGFEVIHEPDNPLKVSQCGFEVIYDFAAPATRQPSISVTAG